METHEMVCGKGKMLNPLALEVAIRQMLKLKVKVQADGVGCIGIYHIGRWPWQRWKWKRKKGLIEKIYRDKLPASIVIHYYDGE